jgi:hypothetical protein
MISLSEFCSKHPLTTVRYVLPGFSLDKHHPNPGVYFLIKGTFYRYALRQLLPADASHMIPIFAALFQKIHQNVYAWLHMTEKSLAKLAQEITAFHDVITNDGEVRSSEQIEAMMRSFCTRGAWIVPMAMPYKIPSVSNLKFYPTCTEFDAAEFKHQMLHSTYGIMVGILLSRLRSNGLIDAWVDMAQKWVEDGI